MWNEKLGWTDDKVYFSDLMAKLYPTEEKEKIEWGYEQLIKGKENKMPIKTGIDYELKGFTFVPVYKYEVKKIIHSGPCTIVFWEDGTKTVVRLEEGKEYDEYAAFTAALAKKVYGSNSQIRKILEKKTVDEKPKKQKEKESPANVLQTLIDNISEAFDIANREDMTKC